MLGRVPKPLLGLPRNTQPGFDTLGTTRRRGQRNQAPRSPPSPGRSNPRIETDYRRSAVRSGSGWAPGAGGRGRPQPYLAQADIPISLVKKGFTAILVLLITATQHYRSFLHLRAATSTTLFGEEPRIEGPKLVDIIVDRTRVRLRCKMRYRTVLWGLGL